MNQKFLVALLTLVPWVYSFDFKSQNSFRKTMSSVISPFDFFYDDALQSAFSIVNLDIQFLSWDSINLPILSYTLFWFWWKNSSTVQVPCTAFEYSIYSMFSNILTDFYQHSSRLLLSMHHLQGNHNCSVFGA